MASEHSPLLSNSHSNNYTPLERAIGRSQQHAPEVTDTDVTNDLRCPQDSVTNSINSSDDDIKLSTDSSSFMPHLTNNIETMMNFMKGMLGTGILAIPAALKYSGLWVGFVSLGFLGIINGYCMNMLVNCSACLCARTGQDTMSYSDVAAEAFKTGPRPLRKFASLSRIIINVFLCITQFGFCIIYILFVAKTVKQMVDDLTSVHLSLTLYMFVMVLLLLPFMFVRNLKHLAPFSVLANILVLTGLIVIVQYCVRGLPTDHYPPAFASWKTLPLYFGIALYAFEGIGVVLPIENKMRRRQDFGGWTGVLTTGMVLVVVMYMTLGFYGYLMYQDKIEGTITLNLPTDSLLFLLVKVAFAVAIFITYGLQFYVPIQILWPLVQRRLPANSWSSRNGELIIRFIFVLATFAIAATVPQLELMISLIGAFSSTALALIFPPIIDAVTFWPRDGTCGSWKLAKDIAIGLFGLCGFTAGTVVTLIKLIHTFEYGSTDT